jgi:hypothetical protein
VQHGRGGFCLFVWLVELDPRPVNRGQCGAYCTCEAKQSGPARRASIRTGQGLCSTNLKHQQQQNPKNPHRAASAACSKASSCAAQVARTSRAPSSSTPAPPGQGASRSVSPCRRATASRALRKRGGGQELARLTAALLLLPPAVFNACTAHLTAALHPLFALPAPHLGWGTGQGQQVPQFLVVDLNLRACRCQQGASWPHGPALALAVNPPACMLHGTPCPPLQPAPVI